MKVAGSMNGTRLNVALEGKDNMKKFEEKHPYCWLILGLILTLLS